MYTAIVAGAQLSGNPSDFELALEGSELNATQVWTTGAMVIGNTNLTVLKSERSTYSSFVKYTVTASNGITLKDRFTNGKVVDAENENRKWQYVTTGDDDNVELKASETPAYYGPDTKPTPSSETTTAKSLPKTGDSTMMSAAAAVFAAAVSAAAGAFALRRRQEER